MPEPRSTWAPTSPTDNWDMRFIQSLNLLLTRRWESFTTLRRSHSHTAIFQACGKLGIQASQWRPGLLKHFWGRAEKLVNWRWEDRRKPTCCTGCSRQNGKLEHYYWVKQGWRPKQASWPALSLSSQSWEPHHAPKPVVVSRQLHTTRDQSCLWSEGQKKLISVLICSWLHLEMLANWNSAPSTWRKEVDVMGELILWAHSCWTAIVLSEPAFLHTIVERTEGESSLQPLVSFSFLLGLSLWRAQGARKALIHVTWCLQWG